MAETMFEVDRRGVATLTLNRPDRFNSLDSAMTAQILAHLDRCANDPAVRVLCIRGAGKHFCAGADLHALPGKSAPGEAAEEWPSLPAMLRKLDTLPVPAVALVQGACIGGAAAMVACCDVAIAEQTAFLAITETRLGIPPVPLIPYFAAAIGRRQLRRYALGGERIDAERCREIGFVHEVCAPGKLAEAAAPIVDALLRAGPKAIGRAKIQIAAAGPGPASAEQEAALQAEIEQIAVSPEATEGIAAFLAKRAPKWYPNA